MKLRSKDRSFFALSGSLSLEMQGRGMPLPARHCRSEQAIMKMSRTPDLSLRGGAADVAISQYPAGSQESHGENVTGCERLPRPLRGLAMTRQGGAAVHQSPHAVKLPPTRRSLSAATDAIGLYGLSLPCTSRKCLPEIATSAVGLLAMTNLGASCCRIHAADAVSRARGNNEDLQRQGNAVSAFP